MILGIFCATSTETIAGLGMAPRQLARAAFQERLGYLHNALNALVVMEADRLVGRHLHSVRSAHARVNDRGLVLPSEEYAIKVWEAVPNALCAPLVVAF